MRTAICIVVLMAFFLGGCVNKKRLVLGATSVERSGDSVKVCASDRYDRNFFYRVFWGSHYRKVWSEKIKVPLFDPENLHGGLEPVSRGGGFQTTNVLLRAKDGKIFTVRTIDKDPTKSLTPFQRKTILTNLVIDQTSAINPYGALVVPELGKAIGLFCANPALYFIPSAWVKQTGDTMLAPLAGKLVMMEEKFRGDVWKNKFPGSDRIISSDTLRTYINRYTSVQADSFMYVKARLFDILINDYDRHPKQWEWIEYVRESFRFYVPIPVDRDYAFCRNHDGMFPWLLSRRLFVGTFRNLNHNIPDMKGLTLKSRPLDSLLLTGVSSDQWLKAAREIKNGFNETVVDAAFDKMPPEIQEKIKRRMKKDFSRRLSKVENYALKYHRQVVRYKSKTSQQMISEKSGLVNAFEGGK